MPHLVKADFVLADERAELLDATHGLVREFDHLPAGYVIACAVRCRDTLEQVGVRAGLATSATAMARARLRDARHCVAVC